jgi:hypothetical protein
MFTWKYLSFLLCKKVKKSGISVFTIVHSLEVKQNLPRKVAMVSNGLTGKER